MKCGSYIGIDNDLQKKVMCILYIMNQQNLRPCTSASE